ncbi:MAG: Calx-beta domain-containing protein [Aeromicrobium sp.]
MRPPFGETDARIKKLISRQHLTQEMWTIDTNDWRGGSAKKIAKSALRGLRAHQSNVILMHDAVANSPKTIKAIPAIIRGLRKKGYCLVPLQAPPVKSTISANPIVVDEGATESSTATVRFILNAPSYRPARFRVHSVDGTAKAGRDYLPVDRVVTVKRGAKSASIELTVFADPMPNANKRFNLALDEPSGLGLGTSSVSVTISDNGTWDLERSRLIEPK